MRIVSGQYKGRTFHPPNNLPSRPTKDIAKEALFNILAHQLEFNGITAFDLFAGTGNISYELASRGAARILAVEKDPRCVRFVQETIQKLGTTVIQVVRSDVITFIKNRPGSADLIFLDPPYTMPNQQVMIQLILDTGMLNPGGILVIEHDRGHDFSGIAAYTATRQYGNSYFSFMEVADES